MANYMYESKAVEFNTIPFDDTFILYSTYYYYIVYLQETSGASQTANITLEMYMYTPEGQIIANPIYQSTLNVSLNPNEEKQYVFITIPQYFKFRVNITSDNNNVVIKKVKRVVF